MNKDIILIILLIVVVLFALYYLLNKNNKENYALESFSQQNSLSTYFQQTIDSDEQTINKFAKNKFNGFEANNTEPSKHWDGNWTLTSEPSPLYISFLQVNDKLIISISKSIYSSNVAISSEPPQTNVCSLNTFVGVASLNNSGNYFILETIICNNLGDFNLTDKKLYGFIEGTGAKLSISFNNTSSELTYDNDGISIRKKTSDSAFTYDNVSSYLSLSSYITPIPQYTNSYEANMDVCANSTFGTYGKGTLRKCDLDSFPRTGDEGYNGYGTGCTINDNTDINNPNKTCLINMPTSANDTTPLTLDGYTNCTTIFDINRKFNSNLNKGLYDTYSNNGICSYLNKFSTFNSAIIMYISDLTQVQSLNYEYFGQGKNKSSLTMQSDITKNFMEKILSKFRGFITSRNETANDYENNLSTALSLTNCFETSNSSDTYSNILKACNRISNPYPNTNISDVIPENGKKPLIWKLNLHNTNNSSCTFSLSSSNIYKKENQWVKYAEFNPLENKTNMSLYKDGTNQLITLENASILSNPPDNSYILLSGNLKTSNPKKYLIPSNIKSGFFNNSSIINLQNNLNNNGKWVILGFDLTREIDLLTKLNSIQSNM